MTTEVEFGYALPIPIDIIHQMPHAAVAPLGLVFQDTIDEFGTVKVKARATHDQSFAFLSGLSVNDRVIHDQLIPCQYGHCLLCILEKNILSCTTLLLPVVSSLMFEFL